MTMLRSILIIMAVHVSCHVAGEKGGVKVGRGVSQRRRYNQEHKREGISVLYKVRGKALPRKEEQSGEIWRWWYWGGQRVKNTWQQEETRTDWRVTEGGAGSCVVNGRGRFYLHGKAGMETGHKKRSKRWRWFIFAGMMDPLQQSVRPVTTKTTAAKQSRVRLTALLQQWSDNSRARKHTSPTIIYDCVPIRFDS